MSTAPVGRRPRSRRRRRAAGRGDSRARGRTRSPTPAPGTVPPTRAAGRSVSNTPGHAVRRAHTRCCRSRRRCVTPCADRYQSSQSFQDAFLSVVGTEAGTPDSWSSGSRLFRATPRIRTPADRPFVMRSTRRQTGPKWGSSHLGGEHRVRMRGGEGRSGQVTPPVWSRTRSR